jgi:DNA-binding LytR/AlgR family response regulator
MNCVLVDDEPMDLLALKELMKSFENVNIIGDFLNPVEALEFTKTNKVELLVLDVEMPTLNGIEFIKSVNNVPHVILISSNKNYAAESYDYNVTDYIVKPVSKERLGQSIQKLRSIDDSIKMDESQDFAFVKDGNKIVRIDFSEVLFIEALADYVQINSIDSKVTVLSTMKSMQSKLPRNDFFRVHRSFIVRKDKIKVIEDNLVIMKGKNIPISRSVKQEFFNTFKFL